MNTLFQQLRVWQKRLWQAQERQDAYEVVIDPATLCTVLRDHMQHLTIRQDTFALWGWHWRVSSLDADPGWVVVPCVANGDDRALLVWLALEHPEQMLRLTPRFGSSMRHRIPQEMLSSLYLGMDVTWETFCECAWERASWFQTETEQWRYSTAVCPHGVWVASYGNGGLAREVLTRAGWGSWGSYVEAAHALDAEARQGLVTDGWGGSYFADTPETDYSALDFDDDYDPCTDLAAWKQQRAERQA